MDAQPHYAEIAEGSTQVGELNYEAPSALHESEYAVGLQDSALPARTAARRAALAEALARDAARSGGASVNPTDQAYEQYPDDIQSHPGRSRFAGAAAAYDGAITIRPVVSVSGYSNYHQPEHSAGAYEYGISVAAAPHDPFDPGAYAPLNPGANLYGGSAAEFSGSSDYEVRGLRGTLGGIGLRVSKPGSAV